MKDMDRRNFLSFAGLAGLASLGLTACGSANAESAESDAAASTTTAAASTLDKKVYSVNDPEFAKYGQVLSDVDPKITEAIVKALNDKTPLPEAVEYVPEEKEIQNLAEAKALEPTLYAGIPAQFGWCNGHNVTLNCLEYHRSSEFNMGVDDFVLLLAHQDDIVDGKLDTASVKAFRAPGGTLVEVFATTLHYAPCMVDDNGFKVLVALPKGTNLDKPEIEVKGGDSDMLWASNKWLLAHSESSEAAAGAHVGLEGKNLKLTEDFDMKA